MKIGYARVSTKEQHLDMQLEALKAAGCEKIFSEKMTGRQQNRPELEACLNFLREGDTLVVYKLDRLGRSLKNILTLLEDFKIGASNSPHCKTTSVGRRNRPTDEQHSRCFRPI